VEKGLDGSKDTISLAPLSEKDQGMDLVNKWCSYRPEHAVSPTQKKDATITVVENSDGTVSLKNSGSSRYYWCKNAPLIYRWGSSWFSNYRWYFSPEDRSKLQYTEVPCTY